MDSTQKKNKSHPRTPAWRPFRWQTDLLYDGQELVLDSHIKVTPTTIELDAEFTYFEVSHYSVVLDIAPSESNTVVPPARIRHQRNVLRKILEWFHAEVETEMESNSRGLPSRSCLQLWLAVVMRAYCRRNQIHTDNVLAENWVSHMAASIILCSVPKTEHHAHQIGE